MKWIALPLLALFLGMATAACAGTLNVSLGSDIRSTEPGQGSDDSTNIVLLHIVEGLVAAKQNGEPAMMLADHVDISPDGLHYTFTLRDVVFHSGRPLTAEDVVWTWKRYLDPQTHWFCRAYFDGSRVIRIKTVEALQPRIVRFTLEKPVAEFLSMMARPDCGQSAILSPESVNRDGSWKAPIGTGPYRFSNWEKGEYIDLQRFDRYTARKEAKDGYAGNKTAYIDRLHFLVIPDPVAIKNALLKGDIDLWYSISNAGYVASLEKNPDINISYAPGLGLNLLLMQSGDPVLRDSRIRHAIAMAIDAKAISKVEFLGLSPVNNSLVGAASSMSGPVEKYARIPYDPAAAKKLLQAAGYHGEPITLLTTPQFKGIYDVALIIQAMGQLAGINIQVEAVEFSTMLDAFLKGKYQLMVFFTAPSLDPLFNYDRFTGAKRHDPAKVWDDSQAQSLVFQAMNEPDPARRQHIIDTLHLLFLKDLPMLPMQTSLNIAAARKHIKCFAAWPGLWPRFWGVRIAP